MMRRVAAAGVLAVSFVIMAAVLAGVKKFAK